LIVGDEFGATLDEKRAIVIEQGAEPDFFHN
jgi:hypothetical protein